MGIDWASFAIGFASFVPSTLVAAIVFKLCDLLIRDLE